MKNIEAVLLEIWDSAENDAEIFAGLGDLIRRLYEKNQALTANPGATKQKLDDVLAMFTPPDDHPFFCEGCLWFGDNVEVVGDTPMDEWLACPNCGDEVEKMTQWHRDRLAFLRTRVKTIMEGGK